MSIEQGLEYQAKHLSKWKQVLNENTYNQLRAYCKRRNANLRNKGSKATGHDVARGDELTNFIVKLSEVYFN